MTSSVPDGRDVFVWVWLPLATEPVVAGRLIRHGARFDFVYGRSYLERRDAIPLYLPELPLSRGVVPPPGRLELAGCLRDGLPDAWGRRVLIDRLVATRGRDARDVELDDVTYMLESSSNRTGALDFQASADRYVPRDDDGGTLQDLEEAARRVERGEPVPESLALALFHGTSIGGARPKAVLRDGRRQLIAKFSASQDTYEVVKAEFVAMRLAQRAGLDVADVELTAANGRDVLLVERFDRIASSLGWTRRAVVSALTLLGEHELTAHHASYADLADIVRARFAAPSATLRELFGRMAYNVLVGNTDDHARNHAAFWSGASLSLTPAYDICPQARPTREANQALVLGDGDRRSLLATCVAISNKFLLRSEDARELIDGLVDRIVADWESVCDEARLGDATRRMFAGRQFLNPYAFEGYGPVPSLR